METETMLSRREATLRSAATTCLAGIALVQAIELPSLFVQGRQFVVLSLAAMALCIGVGLALCAAPAGAGERVWRVVAATGGAVLAGWAVPRAFVVPGLAHHAGHWTAMPGVIPGVLGAVCLVLAVVAVRPTRASARGLATALAVLVALAPGVGALLVALGPGVSGGETALAAGVHVHAHGGLNENIIRYQALPGGRGGHYVYPVPAPAHQTALGVALIVAAASIFIYGAVGYLRRRSEPRASVALSGLERGLA